MRLVFLGTPHFAVPTLDAILAAGHEVAAVYTQPDRPKGRGQQLTASPVKQAALRHGLPIHQPLKIRHCVDELAAIRADAMIIVGYGQIIPQVIIDLPPHGIINVHASLLPKYRGAAPIQWAIANCEAVTGVTTMRINAGLDTGDMLLARETPIGAEETAIELGERLALMGAELLVETLASPVAGWAQDDALASYAPILKKEDGRIDWSLPVQQIHCRLRGFQPWPGAYTSFRGQKLLITRARVWPETVSVEPGTLFRRSAPLAACGSNTALELLEVQLEGRKKTDAASFANGQRLVEYERLGEPAH